LLLKWWEYFEVRLSSLIDAFLNETELSRLAAEGIESLIRLGVRTSIYPDSLKKMEIRIGMGVDDKGVSDRTLAYLISAVRIIKNLKRNGFQSLPTVLIYSAAESVITANQLDRDSALMNRKKIVNQCRSFLEKVLPPDLLQYFIFIKELATLRWHL
jgi:hypothetical protein